MPDLSTQIETVAGEDQSITTDGQSTTSHSLQDLIAADKYLKENAAATAGIVKSAWARTRVARATPPGADPT